MWYRWGWNGGRDEKASTPRGPSVLTFPVKSNSSRVLQFRINIGANCQYQFLLLQKKEKKMARASVIHRSCSNRQNGSNPRGSGNGNAMQMRTRCGVYLKFNPVRCEWYDLVGRGPVWVSRSSVLVVSDSDSASASASTSTRQQRY